MSPTDPARPLTPAQQAQLRMLLAAGAVSPDTGKGPFDLGMRLNNPMVIGKLRELGLADSRTIRPGERGPHGQFTAYWLTAAGVGLAQALEPETVR